MRFAYFLAFAPCLIGGMALAAPVHMSITIGGGHVGDNTYELLPDGSFSSATKLAVGAVSLKSSVAGHFKAGVLTDFVTIDDNPSGKTQVTLANGTITSTKVGSTAKPTSLPFKNPSGLLFGNVNPQFCTSALNAAEKALNSKPDAKETTVQAFIIDVGAVIPMTVRLLPARSVMVDGKNQAARRFDVSLGALEVEYDLNDANQLVGMNVPSQKLQMIADGWSGLFVDPLTRFPELSQPAFTTTTDEKVMVQMRDGVHLATTIVRPNDGLKHPAILVRTPYGRSGEAVSGAAYATRGYAYIVQDCRGRDDSEGEWDPFVHEGKDGADTIAWVAKQPWCDGKVGMIGGSYGGYVQWAAAVENPPALKCIVPQVSPPDAMHNIPFDYGVPAMYVDLWWAQIVAGKTMNVSGLAGGLPHPEKLSTLPLNGLDKAVLGVQTHFFDKWLSRTDLADWKGFDFTSKLANVQIPALHISGTWDGDGIGTYINWQAMRSLKRKNQWIVFGPWEHAFNTTHKHVDVEYGPGAIIDLDSVFLRWFDTWLKGKDVGFEKIPHVRLFVTGANRWVDLPDWPAPSTPVRSLYFGKGTLSSLPASASKLSYTYDPGKDTTIPKALLHGGADTKTLRLTAKELSKPNVYLFKSPPLKKRTAITGPFDVSLSFKTSAVDTDFFAIAMDMAPDGSAYPIGMPGKIRGSYLKGVDKRRALVPGKVYTAHLTPWEFAHEFAPGHRIVLAISPTGFPMYARNLGTMEPIASGTKMVAQHNQLLFGPGTESRFSYHLLWEK